MRLTLRTLLAYLDDILEPAQAREIGRKVQEAPVAKELVSRIRDVVRKRRLKAPTIEGAKSGLDPNVVAEYLDNQLTPAQVAQTERILLNSEMHLAETASAHQILTLVLGEPVEVLPDSRSRMYALGPVADGDKLLVESDQPPPPVIEPGDRLAVPQSAATAGRSGSNGSTNTSDAGVELAEYVKSQQPKRAWWPLVGVGLLIGLFVALQWTDPEKDLASKMAEGTVADSTPATPDKVTKPLTPADSTPAVADSSDVESPPPAEPATSNPATEQPSEVVAANANDIDAPEPPDVPETATPEPAMTEPADTTSVAVDGVEPTDKPEVTLLGPPGSEDDKEEPATGMPAPPTDPVVVDLPGDKIDKPEAPEVVKTRLTYLDSKGILLRETADDGWQLVAIGTAIGDNQRIATPRPYVARFVVPNSPVEVHLAAGSRMATYAAPDAAMGIRIERGRVVVSRTVEGDPGPDATQPADQNNEPIAIRIAVGEKRWTATLPATQSRIAIDVTPVPPIRLDKNFEGFPYKVWAVGNLGSIPLESADGEMRNIGSEDRIALAGPKSGEVLVEPGLATDWLVGKDPVAGWVAGPTAPTDKRDAIRFAKEFEPTDSAGESMPALLKHERSWMARRAVQCLSLTQDYVALISALAIAEHDEATAEAILGIREWLSSKPGNGELLLTALNHEFTDEDSQTLYQLLWGYDEGHARDQKASRELVRWLSHDRPAVRRLAYFHILRLTGMQDEYRPSLTRDRMNSFRKRWERQVEKHGTLLKD